MSSACLGSSTTAPNMALEAPLRSSLQFPFGSHPDMSTSPDPDSVRSASRVVSSPPPNTDSSSLLPSSANRISSNYSNMMSPSDIVGPSPVTSNGTETTEIEDDATEEVRRDSTADIAPERRNSEALSITTNLPENVRHSSEEAVSVIHAPESFTSWKSGESTSERSAPREERRSSSTADEAGSTALHGDSDKVDQQPLRPPISTDVKPVRYSVDSATPRAQDLHDMLNDESRLRSSSTSSLEKIEEQTENEGDDDDDDDEEYTSPLQFHQPLEEEILRLRTAFQESWNLCNTLASLSSIHRTRVFNSSGTPDAHERAWQACWKLCQRLYDSSGTDDDSLNVRMSLDLCRDFCQALFDIRQRKDEAADSVLRVSFELNNHLYSAQDNRNLPEPFRERTLDFYITLCHRLMKQRDDFAEETDQLLRACWSLTEMLFSLRQNKRDGRPPDEELLKSAVRACWDLMDIFRHGWTQVHPDRNTPRPSQANVFSHPSDRAESRASNRSSRHSKRERESVKSTHHEEKQQQQQPPQPQPQPQSRKPPFVPETPVTEFEDTPVSPESRSPQMPNIMVLGTAGDSGRGGRWSSNASNLSSYSHSTQSSARTSSTATTTANNGDPNLARAKLLVLRAAMNLGLNRDSIADPKTGSVVLQNFVQNLPPGSFGPQPSHATLLQQYKNSVLTDMIIPRSHALPVRGKHATAQEMAKSIQIISQASSRYTYLRELFNFVFKFPIDEVDSRRHVSIFV